MVAADINEQGEFALKTILGGLLLHYAGPHHGRIPEGQRCPRTLGGAITEVR
jgi:hypothetical protein